MKEPISDETLKYLARKSIEAQLLLNLMLLVLTAMVILWMQHLPQSNERKAGFGLVSVVIAVGHFLFSYRKIPMSFEMMRELEPRGMFWWIEVARIASGVVTLLILIGFGFWAVQPVL
jgi:hypothetical protein